MDFAKAFDKVPHRRLAYKLEYCGSRNDILQWITIWLSGRTQKVVIDGISSDPAPVLSGVLKGSILGPILFLIFINDLPNNIHSTIGFLQMTVSFIEILEVQRANKYSRMTGIN